MLRDVGMIGRAVDREIERDLHPAARGFVCSSQAKSSSVPNDGSTSLWPPPFGQIEMAIADRVGDARLARLAGDGVVASFSIR